MQTFDGPAKPLLQLPRAELGEGPRWDGATQSLIWVDIAGYKIHRWHPASGRCETHDVGTMVGFAMLDRQGRIIAGLRDGIYAMEFGAAERQLVARAEMHPDNRFNDAMCDPNGRLWAGTMHVEASRDMPPTGALYRHCAEGLELREPDIAIANGLGWSPDGTTMYFADTHRGTIFAYAYDLATGTAGARRVFAEVPIEVGVPDGLTVDNTGRVLVAIWRGGRINVYAADGALDEVIALPVACPTSCCLGGEDLRTLYITTNARDGDPVSGYLLAMTAQIPGLPCPRIDLA